MTWDELNAIMERHGGQLSDPVNIDPEIDNPDPSPAARAKSPKVANPNATWRYNLKDGKYFTARKTEYGANTFQIVDPGTAVQPLTPADRLPSPTSQLEKIDAQGNLIPPGSSTPAAKLRDPSTGAVTDLPDAGKDPEGVLKEFGDKLLNIKPDGTFTIITTKDPAEKAQQAVSTWDGPDGARYEYDPNKPEGRRLTKLIDAPAPEAKPPRVTGAGNVLWEDIPGTDHQQGYEIVNGQKQIIEGSTRAKDKTPAALSVNTQARYLVSLDEQGNEISRQDNPNYQPTPAQPGTPNVAARQIQITDPNDPTKLIWTANPNYQPTPAQAPSANTIAPYIQVPDPDDPTKLIWVENRGRVTASEALKQLAAQLTGQVVDPNNPMGVDEAKTLIDAANAKMTHDLQQAQVAATQAQTARGAAGDILQAQTQGAQTGAGLLNQRVQAGQGMLGQVLGLAGQRPMVGLPANAGSMLMNDIQGFATQLGGGQAVYDTAARLVQANDPQGGNSPMAQQAYRVLTDMLTQYQEKYQQPHPLVAATEAANASQQAGGMVAPPMAQLATPENPNPLASYVPSPMGGLQQPRMWRTPAETAQQAQLRAGVFTAPMTV